MKLCINITITIGSMIYNGFPALRRLAQMERSGMVAVVAYLERQPASKPKVEYVIKLAELPSKKALNLVETNEALSTMKAEFRLSLIFQRIL